MDRCENVTSGEWPQRGRPASTFESTKYRSGAASGRRNGLTCELLQVMQLIIQLKS